MVEMRGRNEWFKLDTTSVLVGSVTDEVFVDFYSKKTGQNPPVIITGTKKEVETLLQTLLDKVKGGAG